MKIVKIKGQFLVETLNTTGYITEDGVVFINFKGRPTSKEDMEKNALSLIGFTITQAKIDAIKNIYDAVEVEYGFSKKVAEEVAEEASEEVVNEVTEEAAEVAEEVKPEAPKRRGRRRKEN